MEQLALTEHVVVDVDGMTTEEWFALPDDQKRAKLRDYGRQGYYGIPEKEIEYLQNNLQLFGRFVLEAAKLVKRGREHYSHITILEYIRHETTIAEVDDQIDWKINNNNRAYIGRMAVNIFPAFNGLFDFRGVG